MWLPLLLQQLNEKEMRDMGLKITAEDIYSINHSSLKDAIVQFGGGCTGELVSDKGLMLTNHHCGYSNIQSHSTLEHDYLTNGFWAMRMEEELPNPGLSVTFLVRMEDVTERVLAGVKSNYSQRLRDSIVQANSKTINSQATKGTHYASFVKPFYGGNQYYLFVTETFTDVRLVGAPPSNIGKFGGDTDNWMWPRHTGDFSIFRIYAGKDNKPAAYSKDNVPYTPAKHLNISLKGVREGDFTFVYGFPGTTQEYLPACAVELTAEKRNPVAIALRQQRLDIIDRAMEADRLTRIQYSAKAAGIANYWKKMIGESRGINRLDGIEKKKQAEADFAIWANTESKTGNNYSGLLPAFEQLYADYTPYSLSYTYITEGLLGIEALKFASGYSNLIKMCADTSVSDQNISATAKQLELSARGFFKNYNPSVDQQLFAALTDTYLNKCESGMRVPAIVNEASGFNNNTRKWAEIIYKKTLLSD
jgi:hypothetical protein